MKKDRKWDKKDFIQKESPDCRGCYFNNENGCRFLTDLKNLDEQFPDCYICGEKTNVGIKMNIFKRK